MKSITSITGMNAAQLLFTVVIVAIMVAMVAQSIANGGDFPTGR